VKLDRVALIACCAVFLVSVGGAGEIPLRCPGDCNGDGAVSVAELVLAVNLSLGRATAGCDAADVDGNGSISINELVAAVSAALNGCFPTQPSPTPTVGAMGIRLVVESRERIVSEDGEFELIEGTLSIERISLVAPADEVPLLGPVLIDLGRDGDSVEPVVISERTYSGFSVSFAAPNAQTHVVDLHLRHSQSGSELRVVSDLEIETEMEFPQGPRVISSAADLELVVRLTGALFYLYPISDAIEGVYVIGEDDRNFFSMDLRAMLELRDR
jgi:hypothetical protein